MLELANDLFLLPFFIAIFYFMAIRTRNANSDNFLYRAYYIKGLNYKIIGSVFFALIYVFYYKGGDTISFYWTVAPLHKLMFKDPAAFFKFVLDPYSLYPWPCVGDAAKYGVIYLIKGSASLTTIKIAAIVNILCFNSFFMLCLAFAYISYLFEWRMFMLLSTIYPSLHKQFGYAFLMIPSVIFWGSGLSKDSIMIGCIMYFVYCFYMVFIVKKKILKYLLLLLFVAFIISLIRGFILFTVLPCCIIMAMVYYQAQIKNSGLQFLIGPLLLIVGAGASYGVVKGIGSSVESYSVESLQAKAEGFRSWHSTLNEQGGSGYSIEGELDYSIGGILRKAPVAMAVTLFGPFPWQIRNFVMLMSGIEAILFSYIFIKTFTNSRIYKLFGVLAKDHIIAFCVPFVLVLGTAIGLTSFNYGALVRYRIPIMPFFATFLILVNYHLNKSKSAS